MLHEAVSTIGHRGATGRSSRNLYGWMLEEDLNRWIFARAAAHAEISIVEGMMGMYLTESICDFYGCSHDMVGIFPAEAVMRKPGLTLGYRTVECSHRSILGDVGVTARGHEFHYSTLVASASLQYTCVLSDAEGRSRGMDGLTRHNVLARYTHPHVAGQPGIAASPVESARHAASRISRTG